MKQLALIFATLFTAALVHGQEPNTWTKKADFGGNARHFAVGFSIGTKGYLGTGSDDNNVYKDFWEYDPIANTWTQKADFGGSDRYSAVGFSIDGKGYLGMGYYSGYKKDFWEYDPIANTWTQKADFGGTARNRAVGFSIGSKGYLGTGNSGYPDYTNYKDFREYIPDVCNGLTVYADTDGDGYGDISNSHFSSDCVVPTGYVSDSSDCNDANALINPGAAEIINGIDDNCNGIIDECFTPTNLLTKDITANSVKFKWDPFSGATAYKLRYKVATSGSWTLLGPTGHTKTVEGLSANTKYVWQIKSVCGVDPKITSNWSSKQFFTTAPLKISIAETDHIIPFSIYPNPAKDQTTIQFTLPVPSHASIKVYDVSGKEIDCPELPVEMFDAGNHFISINTAQLSKGIYFVQMISESGIQNEKLIVQ